MKVAVVKAHNFLRRIENVKSMVFGIDEEKLITIDIELIGFAKTTINHYHFNAKAFQFCYIENIQEDGSLEGVQPTQKVAVIDGTDRHLNGHYIHNIEENESVAASVSLTIKNATELDVTKESKIYIITVKSRLKDESTARNEYYISECCFSKAYIEEIVNTNSSSPASQEWNIRVEEEEEEESS